MVPKSPPDASRGASGVALGSPGEPTSINVSPLGAPRGPNINFLGPPRGFRNSPGEPQEPSAGPGALQEPPRSHFQASKYENHRFTTIKRSVLNKKCDSEQTVQLLIAFLALSLLAKMPSKADFFNPAYIKHHVLGCRLPLRRRLKYCKYHILGC